MRKPGRPLGVTLAIAASLFSFCLLPLLQAAMILAVRQHFADLNLPASEPQPFAVGADFLGISESALLIQTVLAFLFLGVALFAWRGRPANVRHVFVGTVIIYTAIKLLTLIPQMLTQQSLETGFSSGDALMTTLSQGQFALDLIVMLYVIWYMNRGPARAFYRGYYLPSPSEAAMPSGLEEGTTN